MGLLQLKVIPFDHLIKQDPKKEHHKTAWVFLLMMVLIIKHEILDDDDFQLSHLMAAASIKINYINMF